MADNTEDFSKYTLGRNAETGEEVKAQEVYDQQAGGQRQAVCDTARLMAELTIPSVFPPDGYKAGDDLPGNNQSLGAQCVNTLASSLMFMAFPPGQPIMRIKPVEYAIQEEVDQDPELWAKTVLALSRLEMAHREKLQATPIATAYTGYIKLLLVAGNALWKQINLEEPTHHRPDCYTVKRDKAGHPLLTIHKECVSLQSMDADHREFILNTKPDAFKDKPEWEREVDVYSVCKLQVDGSGEKSWLYWEEWEGYLLHGTQVETDYDDPPMWAGWLIPEYGQDWGRSYCEEYRGDLFTVEAHASALNDGASAAALSLLFVKPGSATSIRQIREAKNLSTLPGDANDVTMFRTEKSADFNFVAGNLEQAARRLSAAFLLQSSVQRSGERVTAEEIRRLGQELDKALGGLYTQIAQGNQKVIILRAIHLNEEEHSDLPKLPQGKVEVQVITGIDGLGQSMEADALVEYAAAGKQSFPTEFEAAHSAYDFFTRLASAKGIKPDGLVKKPEQVASDKAAATKQAMAASMVDKATGPAVKGMADYAMQNGGGQIDPAQIQQYLQQQQGA